MDHPLSGSAPILLELPFATVLGMSFVIDLAVSHRNQVSQPMRSVVLECGGVDENSELGGMRQHQFCKLQEMDLHFRFLPYR
jgi:hypothetical protein